MQTPAQGDETIRTTRKGAGSTIGFRLNPAEHGQLTAMAERDGVSAHEMARRLVLAGLRSAAVPEVSEGNKAADLVIALRADLAVVLEGVLLLAGALSPEEAKRFVAEKLG